MPEARRAGVPAKLNASGNERLFARNLERRDRRRSDFVVLNGLAGSSATVRDDP
jgi:hypothetical protein